MASLRPSDACRYDSATWADRSTILATLNDPSSWNSTLTSAGFILDSTVGGLEKSGEGEVTGAKVLSIGYLLAANKTLVEEQEDDVPAKGWEEVFLEKMLVRTSMRYIAQECITSFVRSLASLSDTHH